MGQVFSVCVFWFSFFLFGLDFFGLHFQLSNWQHWNFVRGMKAFWLSCSLLTAVNSRVEFVEIKKKKIFFLKKVMQRLLSNYLYK